MPNLDRLLLTVSRLTPLNRRCGLSALTEVHLSILNL